MESKDLMRPKTHVELIPLKQTWNQFKKKSLFPQATFTFPLEFTSLLVLQH